MAKNKMKDFVPRVSVVMPCYNEAKFIKASIDSLVDGYFLKNCELIVVDGMSSDGTLEEVQSLPKQELQLRILKNKKRVQAYGLNMGISEAMGEIIARVDVHCIYPPGYIKNCVGLLETTGASNVGGSMLPKGTSVVQKAIALAMQHPVGVGNAKFHLGNFNGYVDTVYLGTFWKKLFDKIGLYDVNAHPNEDAELNLRILKVKEKIYLDSSIKVIYFPRESLKKLAVQYFKYGKGRCYTTLKHRKMTSFRQIAPVILTIGIFISIMVSFWQPIFLFFPVSNFFILLVTALLSRHKQAAPIKLRILTGLVFFIMHISWGIGFLSGLIHQKNPNE